MHTTSARDMRADVEVGELARNPASKSMGEI